MRAALLLLLLAVVAAGCGEGDAPAPARSTVDGTLVDRDGDGTLEPGRGEPLRDRTELAPAVRPGAVLATVVQITDPHVRDEESPARVPFLDRLGSPFTSTFRPHESLSTQVLAAAVRAANRVGPDATFVTGDIVDSASAAELDQALAVLDGGRVEPDTGAAGYAGVQDAAQPDPLIYRPDLDAPRRPGLLGAAARPFDSPGLDAPWYPALGNHDVLVAGETAPTPALDAFATGARMVVGVDPEALPTTGDPATAVAGLLAAGAPGRDLQVAADARRRFLRPEETIARLAARDRSVRPGAAGSPTLDYAVDLGPDARALVLDTADRVRGARGTLSEAQLAWLEDQLGAAGGRALLVFSHNPLDNTTNGERALALLEAAPTVVATVAGNGHRNRVQPAGGVWQVATSSLADHPMQIRVLRLRRAGAGFALETWMVDHDGAGLAGTARELAYLDAQGGRPQGFAGAPEDRNVRLFAAP